MALTLVRLLVLVNPVAASLSRALRWKPNGVIYRDQEPRGMKVLPSTVNCTEHFYSQYVDHFSWAEVPGVPSGKFQQRYFMYDAHWNKPYGPIFLYLGNEADVGLYVNHTGLMWENAKRFGALLLFSEHRYWGKSCPFGMPCGDDVRLPNPNVAHKEYLTYDQVLEDHVTLVEAFKRDHNASNAPVIVFGGSYGGMQAYWIRNKYPHAIAGAIAASAPIRVFIGWHPEFDSETYWQVITRAANSTGGAAPRCSSNVRQSFDAMMSLGSTKEGRSALSSLFSLCSPLNTSADVDLLYKLQLFTFDTLAMGNYPYPSNYLTQGGAVLPAFPMRQACSHLAKEIHQPEELLRSLSDATKVVTNASGSGACIELPSKEANDGQDCVLCDYFSCTNANPLETEFARDGVHDMFLPEKDKNGPLGGVNISAIEARCQRLYGTRPRWHRMVDAFGADRGVAATRNVFYSNGFLDAWSSGGILSMDRADSKSVLMTDAAHHLDLMFSHPDDPPSVTAARKLEAEYIGRWIKEWQSGVSGVQQAIVI